MIPFEALEGYRLEEMLKYTTENFGSAYTSGFFVVMNKKKWNTLPLDIQQIVERVNEEWIVKSGKLWDELDQSGREFTLRKDHQIISLTREEDERWARAVKPLLEDYVDHMRAKGLPGEKVLKFCLGRLKDLQ
jgi:TRAP-type transport system periplasmic protein